MAILYYIKWLYDNRADVATTFKGSYDYAKRNIEGALRDAGFDIALDKDQVKGANIQPDIPGGTPVPAAEPVQHAQSAKVHHATGKGAALLGAMAGTFGALEAKYHLPDGLLRSVATTESGGNRFAVSPAGAEGLFQLMPGTAKFLGLKEGEEFDPQKASDAAARYLSSLLRMFHGNLNAALAAYNWGPGNVAKNGISHLPSETQAYVQKVNSGMPIGASSRYAYMPARSTVPSRVVHNETHINEVNIQTQATDAKGIARDIPGALQRTPLIYQADSGMS